MGRRRDARPDRGSPALLLLAALIALLSSLALARTSETLLQHYVELQSLRSAGAGWSRLPPRQTEGTLVVPPGGLDRSPVAPAAGSRDEVMAPEGSTAAVTAPPVPEDDRGSGQVVAPREGFQPRGKFVLGPGPNEEVRRQTSAVALVAQTLLVGSNLLLVGLALRSRKEMGPRP